MINGDVNHARIPLSDLLDVVSPLRLRMCGMRHYMLSVEHQGLRDPGRHG